MSQFKKHKTAPLTALLTAPVFEPSVWGPHYWFFMMTIALSYPETPNSVTKRKYYDFIINIPLFIPNPEIGDKFSRLLDRYPVSPYLDNRESFTKWVHFIHNKVNVELGKEEITYEAALEQYFNEYLPKPIYLSDKIKVSKYYIFIFFVLFCLFLIYVYY
jgi:hypothetical protein